MIGLDLWSSCFLIVKLFLLTLHLNLMPRGRFIYVVIVSATLIWCLLIVAAPILSREGGTDRQHAALIYFGFSNICHQADARSFHLCGEKLAVCSRCTGIYVGFLIGLLILPLLRKVVKINLYSRALFFLALVPICLDYGCDVLGIYQNTLISRSVTGLLLGVALAFFAVPSAISGVRELLSKSHIPLTNIPS